MVSGCPWDVRDRVCGISVDALEYRAVHAGEEIPKPSPDSVVKDSDASPMAVACLRRVREPVVVGYRPRRRATSSVRLALVFAVRAWSSRACSSRIGIHVLCQNGADRHASRDRGLARWPDHHNQSVFFTAVERLGKCSTSTRMTLPRMIGSGLDFPQRPRAIN